MALLTHVGQVGAYAGARAAGAVTYPRPGQATHCCLARSFRIPATAVRGLRQQRASVEGRCREYGLMLRLQHRHGLRPAGHSWDVQASSPSAPSRASRQSCSANRLHYDTELPQFVAYMPGGMRMSFRIIIVLWQRDCMLRQQDLCTEGL